MNIQNTAVASEPLLQTLRFEKSSDKQEKVFFVLNGFYPPEVFSLKGDMPRLICDFKNVRPGETIHKILETNGNLILRIRVGIHTSPTPKTRVVLDLAAHKNYAVEQNFFQQDNTYVLTIRPEDVAKE